MPTQNGGGKEWHSEDMDSATKLSPQAHQRLTEELAERSGPTRRHISELIERARELGDLSENGDYHAAKNEQGLNEARIRQLEALLKHAVVVEGTPADTVEIGTVVEVLMEGDDEPSTYLVGSIEERGTSYDVISPGSPLGKALLGHAPGDVLTYEAPSGRFSVEIVAVRPPG
jgi:transcription elongation factor GreA